MLTSLLDRVFKKVAGRALRTTQERWIDGIAVTATIAYVFVEKPSTVWETAAPFIWLLAIICGVHVGLATVEVWREINRQPQVREIESPILLPDATKRVIIVNEKRPPFFKLSLSAILMISLFLLILLAYCVRRAEVASVRTYIYLVPSAELMECQDRVFFVKIVGPRILYHVEIRLQDNRSGNTYLQAYPEIDPNPRSLDNYFVFSPSSPWDEDYSVTVTTRESQSSQQLIVRSAEHKLQFATQVVIKGENKPALRCRDTLLPASYKLASGERKPCAALMQVPEDVPSKLDVYSYQSADGALTVRKLRTLPAPSELDEQSDDRRITEYQHQVIEPILHKFRTSSVLIYFAGGDKSKAYAEEFHQMFFANGWTVKGPTIVPIGDERIIDVQMSVNYQENWNKYNPKTQELFGAFKSAGIKQRKWPIDDPQVPSGLIVLFIGPKSPKDVRPDQCSPADMQPRTGEPHTCDMVKANGSDACPLIPK